MVERKIKNSTTFVAMAAATGAGERRVPSRVKQCQCPQHPPLPQPPALPSTATTALTSKKRIRNNFNKFKIPPKTTTTAMVNFDSKNGLPSKRSPRNKSTRMNRFCIGQHVEIKRSDGRIHGAVIVGFSEEDQLVKVEWYEEGETKGKEVDYYNLLKTNPELNITNGNGNSINDHVPLPPPTTTNTTAATTNNKKQVQIVNNKAAVIPPSNSILSTSITTPVTAIKTTSSSPMAIRMKTSQPKSNSIEVPNRNLRRTMPSEKNFVKNGSSTLNKSFIKPSQKTTSSSQKENFEPTTMSLNTSTTTKSSSNRDNTAHQNQNQSNGTVSKSRQQSEERRIKNSEAKRQKYLKTEIDKSNPNWQFLSMINDYRSQIDFRPISPSDDVIDNRISVCIRKRPLDKREISKKEIDVVTVPNKDHVVVHQPQQKVDLTKYLENQKFRFDYAFDEDCDNEIIYQFTAQPLIKTVFDGGYATVFAYGQTGSGKTHTMCGAFLSGGKTQDYTAGIYALTAEDIFEKFSHPEYQRLKMTIKCSFFEIYGSKVFDLLGKRSELRILEDEKRSVQIVGLSEVTVASPEDVMDLIKQGSAQRSAGTTSANANSSRSHAVFQFILRRGVKEEIHGKFSLIDLAGNERGADTNSSDKQTRREGAEINKSLLALKEVIRAMSMGKRHLPFRYSKLTLVLRDSFNSENAKTCMIGMVSPGTNSVENTLNTLRYADRVKELGSDEDGHVNKMPLSDAEFMLEEIDDDEYYTKPSIIQTSNKHNNHHSNSHHHHNHHHHHNQSSSSPTKNNNINNNELEENLLNKIRNAEERTFEDHHALLTVCDKFEELMQSQNDTDNDVEKYAKHLIATCERGSEAMNNLKDSAKDLLNKLQKEREQTTKKKTTTKK